MAGVHHRGMPNLNTGRDHMGVAEQTDQRLDRDSQRVAPAAVAVLEVGKDRLVCLQGDLQRTEARAVLLRVSLSHDVSFTHATQSPTF